MDKSMMQAGSRVYRYVWSGGETQALQPLTVVRVNPRTVTVRTDEGATLRLDPATIQGPYAD